jgi:hypothetical protein
MCKRLFFVVFSVFTLQVSAQKSRSSYLDINAFYGVAIEHDKSLKTAIQGNPYGFIIAYNIKNKAKKDWSKYFNYPDFGFSALYENTNSNILGNLFGLYTHYNFYLNDRNLDHQLQLRIAFGLVHISKPFHHLDNPDNLAFGSKFAGSAYLKLDYHHYFLKKTLSFNTGLSLIHYSNAGIKSPNLGLNTLAVTLGVNYNLNTEKTVFPKAEKTPKTTSKLRYNVIFRTGINESDVIGSGTFPFYVGTISIEKKINYKSTLTAGTDLFISKFLKEYVKNKQPNTTKSDTKRVGVFVGHELQIQKISAISQIGFNVYYPNKYISRLYERFGFKYRLNNHIFTALTIKVNLFKAESLEFGIGYRL